MKKIKKSLALIPISGTLVVGAFFGIKALNNNNNIYNQSVTAMLQDEPNYSKNVEADNNWISLEDAYIGLWNQVKTRSNAKDSITIELNQNVMFTGYDAEGENSLSRNFEQTIVESGNAENIEEVQNSFKNVVIDMNGHVVQSTINIDTYIEQDVDGWGYDLNNEDNAFQVNMFSKLENITFKNGSFVNIPFFAGDSINSSFINVEFVGADVTGIGTKEIADASKPYVINLPITEDPISISIFIDNIENNNFVNTTFEGLNISDNDIVFAAAPSGTPSSVDFNLLANNFKNSSLVNTKISNISFTNNKLILDPLLDPLKETSEKYYFDVVNTMDKNEINNFIVDGFSILNNSITSNSSSEDSYKISLINSLADTNFYDFALQNWSFSPKVPEVSHNNHKGFVPIAPTFIRGYVDSDTTKLFEDAGIEVPSESIIITEDEFNDEATIAKASQFSDKIWDKTLNEDETLAGLSLKSFVNLNEVEYIVPMITSMDDKRQEFATFTSHFDSEFISNSEVSDANNVALESGTVELNIYGENGKVDDLTQPVPISEGLNGIFSSQLTYDADIITFDVDGNEVVTSYEGFDTYAANNLINFKASEDVVAQDLADDNTYAGLLYGHSFTAGAQTAVSLKSDVEDEFDSNLSNGIDFNNYHESIEFDKLSGEEQETITSANGEFDIDNLNDIFNESNQNDIKAESNLNLTFSLNSSNPEVNGSFSFSLGNLLNPEIANDELDNDSISKFNFDSARDSIQNMTSRLDDLTSTSNEYTLDNLTHKVITLDVPTPKTVKTFGTRETITVKVVNGGEIELKSSEILPDDNPASDVKEFDITSVTNDNNNINVTITTQTIGEVVSRSSDSGSFFYEIHYVVLDANGNEKPDSAKDQREQINGTTTVISVNNISENESIVITNIKLIEVWNSDSTKSTVENTLSSKITYVQHKFISEPGPGPRNSTYIVITTMSVLLLLVLLISMVVIFKTSSKNKVLVEGLEEEIEQDIDSDEV